MGERHKKTVRMNKCLYGQFFCYLSALCTNCVRGCGTHVKHMRLGSKKGGVIIHVSQVVNGELTSWSNRGVIAFAQDGTRFFGVNSRRRRSEE